MKHAAVIALLLAACAPVTTTTDSATAPPGVHLTVNTVSPSVFRLTLHNDSGQAAGYNLCTSALQRRTGGTWTPVPSTVVCTMELRTLASGQKATFDHTFPPDLPRGEYRYVTNVEMPLGTRQTGVASEPFGAGR